jgi:hypothetical protein
MQDKSVPGLFIKEYHEMIHKSITHDRIGSVFPFVLLKHLWPKFHGLLLLYRSGF